MSDITNIIQCMDAFAPFDTQWGFDNSGFLVGRKKQEVTRILVALDITREVVEEAARWAGWSLSRTKSTLFRMRKKLKDYLNKEGFYHG